MIQLLQSFKLDAFKSIGETKRNSIFKEVAELNYCKLYKHIYVFVNHDDCQNYIFILNQINDNVLRNALVCNNWHLKAKIIAYITWQWRRYEACDVITLLWPCTDMIWCWKEVTDINNGKHDHCVENYSITCSCTLKFSIGYTVTFKQLPQYVNHDNHETQNGSANYMNYLRP